MRNIIKGIAFAGMGAIWGAVLHHYLVVTLPTHRIEVAMEACEYIPHPISDMAWGFYARDSKRYLIGSAYFYTGRMNSRNSKAAGCMVWQLDADYARGRGYSK